jgi:hypothetical protein
MADSGKDLLANKRGSLDNLIIDSCTRRLRFREAL